MNFKLLKNYSRATFKSDAPLETFVGNTAAEGVDGTLAVDPSRPQGAKGSVKVDMNTVRTGIEKRDADIRGKPFLETENEANRCVTFEITSVDIAGPLEPGKAVPAKVRGILTMKQKPVERVVDATVTYVKLTGPPPNLPILRGGPPPALQTSPFARRPPPALQTSPFARRATRDLRNLPFRVAGHRCARNGGYFATLAHASGGTMAYPAGW
jgi:polyisoprenoid-binding protein YceI